MQANDSNHRSVSNGIFKEVQRPTLKDAVVTTTISTSTTEVDNAMTRDIGEKSTPNTFQSEIHQYKVVASEHCQNQTISAAVQETFNKQPVLPSLNTGFTGLQVVTVSQPTTPTIYTGTQVLQVVSDQVVLPSVNTLGVSGLQFLNVPDLVTIVPKPEVLTSANQSDIELNSSSPQGTTVIYLKPD